MRRYFLWLALAALLLAAVPGVAGAEIRSTSPASSRLGLELELSCTIQGELSIDGYMPIGDYSMLVGQISYADGAIEKASGGILFPLGMSLADVEVLYDNGDFFLLAGLNAMLSGAQHGLSFSWNNRCGLDKVTSSLTVGWSWGFGDDSYVMAGVATGYSYYYGGELWDYSLSSLFVRLGVYEYIGPFYVEGNASVEVGQFIDWWGSVSAFYPVNNTLAVGGMFDIDSNLGDPVSTFGVSVLLSL